MDINPNHPPKFVNVANIKDKAAADAVNDILRILAEMQDIISKVINTNAASFDAFSFASGVYTPTITDTTNIDASTAFATQYMRVGTIVVVGGKVDIDPTAAANTVTEIDISLPIASNLSASQHLGGTATCTGVSTNSAGTLSANGTADTARLKYYANDTANRSWFFSFIYRIL